MKTNHKTIFYCILCAFLIVGFIFAYQQVQKPKFVMQCVFSPWTFNDSKKSYYFTLSESGMFASSMGVLKNIYSDNDLMNIVKKNKVFKKVDNTNKLMLTKKEYSDICEILNGLGDLKQGGNTNESIIGWPGWNIMIIYNGKTYSFFYRGDKFEDFTSIANKFQELSPITIDWNVNYK